MEMKIETAPEPKKVPVVTFEFMFTFSKGLGIDLYTDMGDRFEEHDTHYEFFFPRLRLQRKVFKTVNLLTADRTESLRIYVDPSIAIARMKAAKQAVQDAKDAATAPKEPHGEA